jgi:exonuclease III
MKILALNIWDARVFDPLMKFFEDNQDIDIFCLQEVFIGE